MRLIDADAVEFNFQYGRDDNGILLVPFRDAKKAIEAAKTVDTVPVTRCKDCKYYKSGKLLYPNKFCFRLKHPTENRAIGYNFGPDDFCSYGERKDGGNEDR